MVELAPLGIEHRHADRRHFALPRGAIADLARDHQHGPAFGDAALGYEVPELDAQWQLE